LTDKNYNYLVVNGGEPSKFVYNNYKTYKTYKQQVFDVDTGIIPYLKNHIKKAKLLPIIGQGKFLFGSNDDTQQNSIFGNKLKDEFYTMYGEEITSRWIRTSAATWINGRSGKNKKFWKYVRSLLKRWLTVANYQNNMRKLSLMLMS